MSQWIKAWWLAANPKRHQKKGLNWWSSANTGRTMTELGQLNKSWICNIHTYVHDLITRSFNWQNDLFHENGIHVLEKRWGLFRVSTTFKNSIQLFAVMVKYWKQRYLALHWITYYSFLTFIVGRCEWVILNEFSLVASHGLKFVLLFNDARDN